MKVAVVGSRALQISDLGAYLPKETSEVISGGALGVDSCAREYALAHDLKLTEFLPDYPRYKRKAPLVRNRLIVEAADRVVALWDGKSRGTMHTVGLARQLGRPVDVITITVDAL